MKSIVTAIIVSAIVAGAASAGVTTLITSKQIKDGTIQLRDIAPAARAALHGAQGPPGPAGLTGPRGFTGLQGPAGKSFDPYKIETDLGELCRGIKGTQDKLWPSYSTTYTYLNPDFRYKFCDYYY
jgi:hypothetical protein